MVNVADFGSVLEIIFAVNSLLFTFEILRERESILEKRYECFKVLAQRKIHLTGNSEAPPLGFVLSSTYAISRLLMILVSISMSVISLGLLIWSGFEPSANVSSYLMALFLAVGLICTPVLSVFNRSSIKKAARIVEEAISSMESVIKNHKTENSLR